MKMSWERGEEDGQPALGTGLSLLLLHAQEPALDALVLVDGRLALDLERQLRRSPPHRQAGARRGRPADSNEPGRRPKDQGLNEGDYVYVDANELDRPYIGWKDDDGPRHKAFRCMVRVKFNPGLPYNFTIMKHTGWIASERSVKAHETRARRPSAGRRDRLSGQLPLRIASEHHAELDDADAPDRHAVPQEDRRMGFTFGFDVDNHAINTVPKETLIRITKAEDGGMGGVGIWKPADHPVTAQPVRHRPKRTIPGTARRDTK